MNIKNRVMTGYRLARDWKFRKQFLLRRSKSASFKEKLDYDAMTRPNYAYGTYYAAMQARGLRLSAISVIEFGVAGGNGLLELEKIAAEVEEELGVRIAVYGFDTGIGMPDATDYRDLPYVWQKGFFEMDVEQLRVRLKRGKLVLGNVAQTVQEFKKDQEIDPIGFVSFDLDYYSSTAAALRIFQHEDRCFLPRVLCYFDDCIGDDWELHSEYTGELLAIKEFNEQNERRKLAKINGLRYKRTFDAQWNESMYVLHIFGHPRYSEFVNPKNNWQISLAE